MKAAIYARISQHDPKVDKPADQVKNCRALAEREGYEVVKVYIDDGISAFTGKTRHSFVDLYDDIEAEEFDVILAAAEDRLSRTSEEKIGFQVHCAKHGVKWHTIAGGRVDPSTAQGALLSTITGAIAQYESHVKRERLRASVARRVAEGKDLGGPRPFGFEADRRTIREREAVLVREAYRILLEEGSVYAVTKMLNRSGAKTSQGKEWGWSSVRLMLKRRRNAGILEHKGEEVGRIEGIISLETFEAAQSVLASAQPRTAKGTKPTSLVAGIVLCGKCHEPLLSGGAYYRCWTGKFGLTSEDRSARVRDAVHPTISKPLMDRLLVEQVFLRLLSLDAADEPEAGAESASVAPLRIRLADIERQRDVAQELAYLPGANMKLVAAQMQGFADEIEALEAEIRTVLGTRTKATAHALAREALREIAPGVRVIDGPEAFEAWRPHFDALPVEKRRAIVQAIFTSIVVTPKRRGADRVVFDWPGKVPTPELVTTVEPF